MKQKILTHPDEPSELYRIIEAISQHTSDWRRERDGDLIVQEGIRSKEEADRLADKLRRKNGYAERESLMPIFSGFDYVSCLESKSYRVQEYSNPNHPNFMEELVYDPKINNFIKRKDYLKKYRGGKKTK